MSSGAIRLGSTLAVALGLVIAASCGGDVKGDETGVVQHGVCGDGACDKDQGENYGQCPADCEPESICGDTICDADTETCTSCPDDCGSCTQCGNGDCEMGETQGTCPADCHCGDGKCDTAGGETAANCTADCNCGNKTCEQGETCGNCPADCPGGGTVDCMANDLKTNCCNTQNGNQQECEACGNTEGCSDAEAFAYCHRFDPNPNAWDDLLKGWVADHCGVSQDQVSVTDHYECTNSGTCTTYTCQL